MNDTATYRPHLDGIRAGAVGMVICFHLGYAWIPGGFIGVDVFFVLSGYLITGLLVGEARTYGRIRLSRFYARRARRLLPASIVVIAATMATGHWLLNAIQRDSLGRDARWSALYGANWRFATVGGDYFAPGDVPSALVHYWSLAVEEQFYVVWPVLFLLLHRLSRHGGRDRPAVLLVALGALTLASATAGVVQVGTPTTYYGTHTRAYQLLAGALLAIAVGAWHGRARISARAGGALTVVAAAWLARMAATIPNADRHPGWDGIAVTVATVALIVGLDLSERGWQQRVAGAWAPAAVGRWSYSLYVWHWPILVFLPVLAERWDATWLAERSTAVAAIAVVAGLSYLVIERPIRFRFVPSARSLRVVGLGLAATAILAWTTTVVFPTQRGVDALALAAVQDMAVVGDCPYSEKDWAEPGADAPCVWREGTGPTYALVGDSHAHMWQSALEVLADEHDATVVRVVRRSCPANDVVSYRLSDQRRAVVDEDCVEWRRKVFPELIDEYDPDVIFVVTRSHVLGIADGDDQLEPGTPEHLRAWTAGWDWTLDTLTAGHGTVALSTALPSMPEPTPACVIDHGIEGGRCDMPATDDTDVVAPNRAIRSLVDRHRDLVVVDTTEIVCPRGICPAAMGGVLVRRDDDHLSVAWAHDHAGDLGQLFEAAGVELRTPARRPGQVARCLRSCYSGQAWLHP